MNRELDGLLIEWAEWCAKLHCGALGYPSKASGSVSEPISTRGKGEARVPVISVPARLRELDRAMRELPGRHRLVVQVRYESGLSRDEQEAHWRLMGRSVRHYYHAVDRLHEWLDGRMA